MKRALTSEWGWKASKWAESLGVWSRKSEAFFQEKWSERIKKKTWRHKYEIFYVWDKILNTESVRPEQVNWKPYPWLERYSMKKLVLYFEIKSVSINKMWKPTYLCISDKWDEYVIKPWAWQKPLELYKEWI